MIKEYRAQYRDMDGVNIRQTYKIESYAKNVALSDSFLIAVNALLTIYTYTRSDLYCTRFRLINVMHHCPSFPRVLHTIHCHFCAPGDEVLGGGAFIK